MTKRCKSDECSGPFTAENCTAMTEYQRKFLNKEYEKRCRDASSVSPEIHLNNLIRDIRYLNIDNIKEDEDLEFEYEKYAGTINDKPDTGICVFCSDWNKDYWAFYAWIDGDNYAFDIEQIGKLVKSLNWRDGDVYFERIDYTGEVGNLYEFMKGYDSEPDVFDTALWEVWEEKGDLHFLFFNGCVGGTDRNDLENAEFTSYSDWDEKFEAENPELYKALDDNHAWHAFDTEQFYNGESVSVLVDGDDRYLVEVIL